jgi:hypothetical protein
MEKMFLKFMWNFKGPYLTREVLKKNKVGVFTFPDFKNYYKSVVIKTMLVKL